MELLLLGGGVACVLALIGWMLHRLDRARRDPKRNPYAYDAIDSAEAGRDGDK